MKDKEFKAWITRKPNEIQNKVKNLHKETLIWEINEGINILNINISSIIEKFT